MAWTTLGCLLVQLLPVAPPRMLPGIVDTAMVYGQSVYANGLPIDQLSAMPSIHVAWAVLVGYYVWRVSPSRWRYIGPAHSVMTIFVVVATGNHWWLDGIVGVLILVVCAWSVRGVQLAWQAWRGVPRPAQRCRRSRAPGLKGAVGGMTWTAPEPLDRQGPDDRRPARRARTGRCWRPTCAGSGRTLLEHLRRADRRAAGVAAGRRRRTSRCSAWCGTWPRSSGSGSGSGRPGEPIEPMYDPALGQGPRLRRPRPGAGRGRTSAACQDEWVLVRRRGRPTCRSTTPSTTAARPCRCG